MCGPRTSVARSGADEFAVVLGRLRYTDDSERVAEKVAELLSEPFTIDGEEINVTVSVGIARYPGDGVGSEMLLRNADAALSYAKARGTGRVQMFEPRMNEELLRRLKVEAGLRRALDNGESRCTSSRAPAGHRQDRRRRSAGAVAPSGTRRPGTGFLHERGRGHRAHLPDGRGRPACRLRGGRAVVGGGARGPDGQREPVAARVPRRSLLPMVGQVLADSGLDAGRLQVEITEASLMRDREKAEQVLRGLQTMGVKIALDNFGTGYSSLSNLRRFPVDIIKIDGQFVRAAPREPADAKIVAALAHLACDLGFAVVAEASRRVTARLREVVRLRRSAGYLLGRPVSGSAFMDLARSLA